jgi:hypothetical protein
MGVQPHVVGFAVVSNAQSSPPGQDPTWQVKGAGDWQTPSTPQRQESNVPC